eukprot:GHVS01086155.1.p1 GENE.GHVS01086155.1~~GHVS01086155.1.p1  ORF type:complete len:224 (-),score=20.06 GHVS01086155.1:393-1064(-)
MELTIRSRMVSCLVFVLLAMVFFMMGFVSVRSQSTEIGAEVKHSCVAYLIDYPADGRNHFSCGPSLNNATKAMSEIWKECNNEIYISTRYQAYAHAVREYYSCELHSMWLDEARWLPWIDAYLPNGGEKRPHPSNKVSEITGALVMEEFEDEVDGRRLYPLNEEGDCRLAVKDQRCYYASLMEQCLRIKDTGFGFMPREVTSYLEKWRTHAQTTWKCRHIHGF